MKKLLGLERSNLQESANAINKCLGIEFSLHESLYRGGDYLRFKIPGLRVRIQNNLDCLEGGLEEKEFSDIKTLIYISGDESTVDDAIGKLTSDLEELRILR